MSDAEPTCPTCGAQAQATVQHLKQVGEHFDPLKSGTSGGYVVRSHVEVQPCGCRIAPGVLTERDAQAVRDIQREQIGTAPTEVDRLRWNLVGANAEAERCRRAQLSAERRLARIASLADEIERGEWSDHWRSLNIHGAIRSRLHGPGTSVPTAAPVGD